MSKMVSKLGIHQFLMKLKQSRKKLKLKEGKQDGTFESLSKKEKLRVDRTRAKLEKNLGSISSMTRLPGAIFVVDIRREQIAVKEAIKLNIPVFAMVDTNTDPRLVDFGIPANDDASKSIEIILNKIITSIKDGLDQRNKEKAEQEAKSEKEDSLENK